MFIPPLSEPPIPAKNHTQSTPPLPSKSYNLFSYIAEKFQFFTSENSKTTIQQAKVLDPESMPSSSHKTQSFFTRIPSLGIFPAKNAAEEVSIDLDNFIMQARFHLNHIDIQELEKDFTQALSLTTRMKCTAAQTRQWTAEEKTTLWSVAEHIAKHHLEYNHLEQALKIRIQTAQALDLAPPLANLEEALDSAHPILGTHLYPVDSSLFKNHTLNIQRREFSNETYLQFNAKLNHSARQRLDVFFNEPDVKTLSKKIKKALPKDFCQEVHLSTESSYHYSARRPNAKGEKWQGEFFFRGFTHTSQTQTIEFKGVGKVFIGSSPDTYSEYNHLTIRLDPQIRESEAAEKLKVILAVLGLGAASSSSRLEDVERIKVLQLFRAFYPKEAYAFEQNATTFEESIESLKQRIGNAVPGMHDKFANDLENMYPQEVYPGQSVWCVQGLANRVREAGGLGLMAGINAGDFSTAIEHFIFILKMGALATQDRFNLGIVTGGASPQVDLTTGGAQSVFARMITRGMPKNFSYYPLAGKMQILYDLNLVERVGYGYERDQFGNKKPQAHLNRENMIDLTLKYETNPINFLSNEICINHRIGPPFIKGIRVENEKQKNQLVQALKKENVVTQNDLGEECVNDIPLEQFIRVGNVEPEDWR